jgi:endoglucanase
MPYRGVNLSSAEWGVSSDGTGSIPGTHGTSYIYPDPAYAAGYDAVDYYIAKGMTLFRLPFRWERLQRIRNQPFDNAELQRLRTTVNRLLSKGAAVLLDPHNYARYGTSLIGSGAVPNSDFADFWRRLANEFKGNPQVLFGLMNEPYGLRTEQWVSSANAAIDAIRGTGAQNLILVPGNAWTGAHSWNQSSYGTPNAVALLNIRDPANNVAFEVHQYFDSNFSGMSTSCVSSTIGAEKMRDFTQWLRANGKKGFLGEFAVGTSQTCLAGLENLLAYLDANQDVYIGWTYWAGGPWWGSSWWSIEPNGSTDKPQMDILERHLKPGTAPAPIPTPTPSCTDRVMNGRESGVDCGGSCPACPTAPGCSDGAQNGTEAGVDCGGPCAACSISSCTDGLKNGSEAGVDCGGSCTPCPSTCQATIYEAENMYHSTGGATSGGWNLWSNGYLSTQHQFAAGPATITVAARGTAVAGGWPTMTVSVGQTLIGRVTVISISWSAYRFSFSAGAARSNIRVAFTNDARTNREDRNPFVDKIVAGCS